MCVESFVSVFSFLLSNVYEIIIAELFPLSPFFFIRCVFFLSIRFICHAESIFFFFYSFDVELQVGHSRPICLEGAQQVNLQAPSRLSRSGSLHEWDLQSKAEG